MSNLTPKTGQSNYDLTNQSYGTLDNFIKLLQDNKIILSSTTLTTKYNIDSTSPNINTNIIGYAYSTQADSSLLGRVYGDAYGDSYS